LKGAEIILCRPPIGPDLRGVTHVIGCDLYYPTARGWKRPWVLDFHAKKLVEWDRFLRALVGAAPKLLRWSRA
jgi:hypothetical protein